MKDGAKRTMANLYWGVMLPGIAIWFGKDGVPDAVEKYVQIFGLLLTWLGLGHAIVKGAK